jgi:hypothetical protein
LVRNAYLGNRKSVERREVVGPPAGEDLIEHGEETEKESVLCALSGFFCKVQVVRPSGAGRMQRCGDRQMNLPATVVRPPGGEKRRRTGGFACGVAGKVCALLR